MLLSAVSVLVVAQSSSEISEGLMNNSVFIYECVMRLNAPKYFTADISKLWQTSTRSHCLTSQKTRIRYKISGKTQQFII